MPSPTAANTPPLPHALLCSGIVLLLACWLTAGEEADDPANFPAAATPPPAPRKLEEAEGIHNLLQLSEQIFSGSEPQGEAAFRTLSGMGIKTIVSVDGARPNLELARKYGLRYVHIPIGYHGVDRRQGLALARAAREATGPIFLHCHHGRHRGPAAAAVACMAADGRSGAAALEILKAAGTGENYRGLWRDVADFQPPAADEELPELREFVEADSLSASMAKLDRHFDNLKLCRAADWKTPPEHPDLNPAQEALILREGLRESGRHLAEGHGAEFRAWLKQCESLAESLEQALLAESRDEAAPHFLSLEASCRQCHRKYRD